MDHDTQDNDNDESTKPIEEWAEKKGMLPAQLKAKAKMGQYTVASAKPNPKHVLFTMAKAHRQWPEGKEVTEEDFDEAVAEAGAVGLR
jgi:hypothetical protein